MEAASVASKTIILIVLTTLISTIDVTSAQDQTRRPSVLDLAPPNVFTFRTASETAIEVATAEIVALRPVVGDMRQREFCRADPYATRLFSRQQDAHCDAATVASACTRSCCRSYNENYVWRGGEVFS
jgi:hypothetical protein